MTCKRPWVPVVLAVTTAAAASCGGGGGGGGGSPSAPKPALQKAASASGDAQIGVVATALSSPLRVLVTLSGSPLAGETVTWSATGTGASLNPTLAVTDASGIASTSWTLAQMAGGQSATATLAGATGSPVTFTATATAATATQLAQGTGDSQIGAPGTTLAQPVAVVAHDAFGNGVSGVSVSWAVTSGPATVTPTSSATDAGGVAQTSVQLGGATGQVVLTGTSTGLTGSPVTFHELSAIPSTASVQIGDNFFKSVKNSTQNPAVDTIGVGGTVTWTWGGVANHSVESLGSPSFASSTVKTSGTYSFTFVTAGTYSYDCSIHGSAMTGTIVVQ